MPSSSMANDVPVNANQAAFKIAVTGSVWLLFPPAQVSNVFIGGGYKSVSIICSRCAKVPWEYANGKENQGKETIKTILRLERTFNPSCKQTCLNR